MGSGEQWHGVLCTFLTSNFFFSLSEPLATALPFEELAVESFISTSAMVSGFVLLVWMGGFVDSVGGCGRWRTLGVREGAV